VSDLSSFPITAKWPARHPERIQLYSLPTPNGVKVSAMLEETGLPYEPHLDFAQVARVLEVFLARPAVVRALNIPERPKT
jgi:GSH-dependent disulfide-bond oxidoreductase